MQQKKAWKCLEAGKLGEQTFCCTALIWLGNLSQIVLSTMLKTTA